jgi:hypothetical protein
VELARRLAREMDEHKTISVSKVYVPNEYTVYLSGPDREAFASFETSLTQELGTYLADHARGEGLSLLSAPVVSLETDTDLRPGEFGIACRMVDPPEVEEEPAAEPPADARAAPPAPEPPPPPPAPVYEPLAGVSGTQILTADQARAAGLVRESLVLVADGSRHRVSKRIMTIGRSRECDLVLADPNVSRTHAEIRHVGLDYFLIDKGSTNGMEVNGHPAKRHALADGDVITIGTTAIRVEKGA